MKAILVDDEADGIKTLQRMLGMHCKDVQVVATCSNAADAKSQIGLLKPDIAFIDIQMPGKSGIDLIRELEERHFEIIFVTAHNEYMLQALQYSAADYLLKPVDEDRLVEAVQRAKKRLQDERKDELTEALLYNIGKAGQPSEMRLCLPTMKGFIILKLEDILYCEAERSYTIFHLEDGKTVTVSRPLAEYETMLIDTPFFRVHKSFLINLHHVKEYQRGEGGTVIMSNKAEIEVSRRKKDLFLARIREIFKY
ncbi:MAG TPA: LytTR family DNA-binding domain-containing protein [Ferruginibacter sp.]|nr:LytTR family DNA-binding domain-containing protein [Ferruginibacter sp.]HNL63903.1 LytTR family DNA-binding domain-containing protein [Ferruginibacter sp.]